MRARGHRVHRAPRVGDARDGQQGRQRATRCPAAGTRVPIVPGARCETTGEAIAAAKTLGFPVMLKAASGGGGKGMRLVSSAEEMAGAWERARSEKAKKFFGDDTVYLGEGDPSAPARRDPGVLGDREGNLVHVFEARLLDPASQPREVVEETPSPAASRDLVARMGAIANPQGAKSVGYFQREDQPRVSSRGGRFRNFYFLEMNTRLQVEYTP